ncbi:MAG: SufD family Fe-S cluster assembly protein [Candidatus Micrarchaeia archaeon]
MVITMKNRMNKIEEEKRKKARKYFEKLNFEKKESPTGFYLGFNSFDTSFLEKEEKEKGKEKEKKEEKIKNKGIKNAIFFIENSIFTKQRFEQPEQKTKEEEKIFDFRKNKFEALNLAFFKNGIKAKIKKDITLLFESKRQQIIRNFFVIENTNLKIKEIYTGKGFASIRNSFLIINSNVEHELISKNSSFVQDYFELYSSKIIQRSFINPKNGFDLKSFGFSLRKSKVKQFGSILNLKSKLWVSNQGILNESSRVNTSLRAYSSSNSSTFSENFFEIKREAKNSFVNIDVKGIKERKSQVFCIPALSIKNKSSVAKHSFSIAKFEREEIEYLKSKGIDVLKAKKILKNNILRWWRCSQEE